MLGKAIYRGFSFTTETVDEACTVLTSSHLRLPNGQTIGASLNFSLERPATSLFDGRMSASLMAIINS